MKPISMAVVSLFFATCLLCPRSNALVYTVYTDYAAFSAAAGATSVYDFESDPVRPVDREDTYYKDHDFGDFSVGGSSPPWAVTVTDDPTYTQGTTKQLFFNTSSYTQDLALTVNAAVTAFGLDWKNVDNNDDEVRVVFDGIEHVLGVKDESGFWGVVATEGEITPEMPFLFGDTPGGSGWTGGCLDNVRLASSTVPEPAVAVLLGTALAGLVWRRRRG